MFTREHVLQDGFGRFRQALVLSDCVCDSCNQHFANTLDLAICRQSAEGLERYRWGVKAPREIEKFRSEFVDLRLADLGDFSGVRVKPVAGSEGLGVTPMSGIAVRNSNDDGFTHFTEDDAISGKWRDADVDWRRGVRFFGDEATVSAIREALDEQGVTFERLESMTLPAASMEADVVQTFSILPVTRRAFAKVAFNYLAYCRGAEFALLPAFDPIRRYIRLDEVPLLAPVNSTFDMPFGWSLSNDQRPVVHWLELTGHQAHRNLLGTVMLFGFMTHTVVLAEDFAGPWFDLPIAHVYNVRTLHVEEQQPVRARWRHEDR